MKKLILSIVAAAAVTLSTSSQADIVYPDGTRPMPPPQFLYKLNRGVANILTFPLEIPRTINEAVFVHGPGDVRFLSEGLTLGPWRAYKRLEDGLYNLSTFLDTDKKQRYRMEPEFMNFWDVLPGHAYMFNFESIDTPGYPSLQPYY
jgi:hypothetical protein